MLKLNRPSRPRRIAGATALILFAAGLGAAAWAAQPARPGKVVMVDAPSRADGADSAQGASVQAALRPQDHGTYERVNGRDFLNPQACAQTKRDPEAPHIGRLADACDLFPGLVAANGKGLAAAELPPPPITTTATVRSVELVNPRARMRVVDDQTGQAWLLQSGAPNTLLRVGITADAVAAGVKIEVVIDPQGGPRQCAKECSGIAREVSLRDGRKVFMPGPLAKPAPDQPYVTPADCAKTDRSMLVAEACKFPMAQRKKISSAAPTTEAFRDLGLFSATIKSVDWNRSPVVIHMIDKHSKIEWALTSASAATFRSAGVTSATLKPGQWLTIQVRAKGDVTRCPGECPALAPAIVLEDGRAILADGRVVSVKQPDLVRIPANATLAEIDAVGDRADQSCGNLTKSPSYVTARAAGQTAILADIITVNLSLCRFMRMNMAVNAALKGDGSAARPPGNQL